MIRRNVALLFTDLHQSPKFLVIGSNVPEQIKAVPEQEGDLTVPLKAGALVP